jgi:hypothetical protein
MNKLRSLELRENSYEHHLLISFPAALLHLILQVQRYNINKPSFPDLLQQQAFNNQDGQHNHNRNSSMLYFSIP